MQRATRLTQKKNKIKWFDSHRISTTARQYDVTKIILPFETPTPHNVLYAYKRCEYVTVMWSFSIRGKWGATSACGWNVYMCCSVDGIIATFKFNI